MRYSYLCHHELKCPMDDLVDFLSFQQYFKSYQDNKMMIMNFFFFNFCFYHAYPNVTEHLKPFVFCLFQKENCFQVSQY